MNILITGAYGFVGKNVVNYLKEYYTLWALDINEFNPGLYSRFFSWNDFEKIPFDQIDVIIHLAGKAHDKKGTSKSEEYFQINTELTKKIFNSFLSSTVKTFFFFSSVKAAADSVDINPLTEDIIPKPKGAYGESKIAAENYIQINFDFQCNEDKFVYIFRPCMIHGPGNKGNLNLLYKFINKGVPYPLGNFDNKRSFTSIDNLNFIIKQSIDININSGIYHIADDTSISTNQLIAIICEVLIKKKRIWNIPKLIIKLTARCGDLLHLPLNTFRLNKLTENYEVSNTKIKKALGIKELPISAEEGLRKTISGFNNTTQIHKEL